MRTAVDRRRDVPAHLRYLERAEEFRGLDLRERFARIFEVNLWGSSESVSGTGSAQAQTRAVRAQLPVLLRQLHVTTLLDLPCGDFGWMQAVDLGDVLLCRDCLVHLSNAHIRDAVENLRSSGSTWLLTTTFQAHDQNGDLDDGDWRPLNLERPPFDFPPPVAVVNEGCSEHDGAFADKSLGLWRIADLPVVRLD